jgi:hypothetical protein
MSFVCPKQRQIRPRKPLSFYLSRQRVYWIGCQSYGATTPSLNHVSHDYCAMTSSRRCRPQLVRTLSNYRQQWHNMLRENIIVETPLAVQNACWTSMSRRCPHNLWVMTCEDVVESPPATCIVRTSSSWGRHHLDAARPCNSWVWGHVWAAAGNMLCENIMIKNSTVVTCCWVTARKHVTWEDADGRLDRSKSSDEVILTMGNHAYVYATPAAVARSYEQK